MSCPSAAKLVQSSATITSVRAPTINGVQYAKKLQTSTPRLLRSRSTCFTPCLDNVPRAWATVLTGAGVLLGVWRIVATYEARNDRAHAALTARIDRLYELLLERLPPRPLSMW